MWKAKMPMELVLVLERISREREREGGSTVHHLIDMV